LSDDGLQAMRIKEGAMPPEREAIDGPQMSRWQSLVEEKIAAARDQGDFDDLPGQGERLRLKENPLAGDWELAFHVLENAEMAPPWMEMSGEIREGEAELAQLIERTNAFIRDRRVRARPRANETHQRAPGPEPRSGPWWWPFRRHRKAPPEQSLTVDVIALEAERSRARREYLERAARLDEVIAAYNAWLPDNLRRLQKPRLPASRAAERFDAASPELVNDVP
jgi:hypothetical protein